MENIEKVILELKKFSKDILTIEKPLFDEILMKNFESTYHIKLPPDYKYFLKKINGFSLMGNEVYGLDGGKTPQSLEKIYYREHFLVQYPQHQYIVPFSPDGRGNFYCFDTRSIKSDGTCPIVFWVSNYLYTDSDAPEVVNGNFSEFVQQVIIDWTLESYDHEGNEIAI
jgi:hypothetical protein